MEKLIISFEAIGKLAGTAKQIPVITEDTVVFGIFAIILGVVFYTNSLPKFKKFYTIIPGLVVCYLVPALLSHFNIISADFSNTYSFAKSYLLPAALVLMTLSIDFQALKKLGWKAIAMFLSGTIGVIIGGPIAILIFTYISPETVGGEGYDAAWRGMSTLAGSWIGGGANQTAMLETYHYNKDLYGQMLAVDIIVSGLWMAILLYFVGKKEKINKWLKADNSNVENLKERMQNYQLATEKTASTTDYMVILAIAFGSVGLAHFLSKLIATPIYEAYGETNPFGSSFLWLVVFATTFGLILSFTKLRKYEGAGASKIGSIFIYILVLAIGMRVDLSEIANKPLIFVVGLIWMAIHIGVMLLVAKLIKAPFFYVAVGSKANIGGAASAPVVAAAFDPSLASVGAVLAVLGYAAGTYGAIACAEMMHLVAP